MNQYGWFRTLATVWFAVQVLYVSIPDYPWGSSLYCAVTGVGNTPTMWLHEIAIIMLIWLGLILMADWREERARLASERAGLSARPVVRRLRVLKP